MATPVLDGQPVGMRLPGEPDDSAELSDAGHWRNTYQELALGFADIAAAEAGTRRRTRVLQVRKLRNRLAFWELRYQELVAAAPPRTTERAADPTRGRGR